MRHSSIPGSGAPAAPGSNTAPLRWPQHHALCLSDFRLSSRELPTSWVFLPAEFNNEGFFFPHHISNVLHNLDFKKGKFPIIFLV